MNVANVELTTGATDIKSTACFRGPYTKVNYVLPPGHPVGPET